MIAKKLLARPSLTLGVTIVLIYVIVALAAPLIAPPEGDSPYIIPKDGFSPTPRPPSDNHPLGTLQSQYDVFYGLIWGTRAALRIGLSITFGRVLIGVLLGLASGYYGGLVDATLMRLTDAFLAFPVMAAAMVMLVVFGRILETTYSGGQVLMTDRVERVLIIALMVFGWMPYARVIRGNVLRQREEEYIQAARSTGVRGPRVMLRHLLPNATQGLFVLAASDVGAMVVLVAAFNYLGFGASTQGDLAADWGQMLSVSRNWIIGSPANAFQYWYTYLPVSGAVVLFSLGWNLVGDGLRDVLDPRLR